MIKSEAKILEKAERSYPYLGIYCNTPYDEFGVPSNERFVVLFTSSKKGVVVFRNDKAFHMLGAENTMWREDEDFEPWGGTVTLSNA